MAYSNFTLNKVKKELGIKIEEKINLFAAVEPVKPSEVLITTLAETVPLALAINTEKARSELIITPLLLEIRRRKNQQISLFSGVDLNVDFAQGLNGYCDFILSLSPEQLTIEAPIMIIIEAKNENLTGGLGQCIATMVAAQLFNQQEGNNIPIIYGAVTTGDIWKFLQLINNEVMIDLSNFYIQDVGKILGVLSLAIQIKSNL